MANHSENTAGRVSYEAIILAGGLGTRLREVVSDLPKCMAPVNGKPFLDYVIEHLRNRGVRSFIFSLGFKHEIITGYLSTPERSSGADFQFSIEQEPLGTGGAIKLACKLATQKNVIVVNGDTFFDFDADHLMEFHTLNKADCTLSLKPMEYFSRYGVVELNEDCSVSLFREKQHYDKGLINAGAYALNVASFLKEDLGEKFSFEKDYLEKFIGKRQFFGFRQDRYFIDIGIPEDYDRAQSELSLPGKKGLDLKKIDRSWTLFIDRDGVINYEKKDDYIHKWDEFRFYEDVKEAMAIFAKKFRHIIVVTNQRGIGRKKTRPVDLEEIHNNMVAEIVLAGGKIDRVYFCPDVDDDSFNRKPNPGMGLQAVRDFAGIDLNRSVMIGNKLSDMQFGRNLGIKTIYLTTTHPNIDLSDPRIDLHADSLLTIANGLA